MISADQLISIIENLNSPKEPFVFLSGPAFIQKAGKNLSKILPYVETWDALDEVLLIAGDTYGEDAETGVGIITLPAHDSATGIKVLFSIEYRMICFEEITSKKPGMGGSMIQAVISASPKDWLITIHHDWSAGFWDHMKKKFSRWKWDLSKTILSEKSKNIYSLLANLEKRVLVLRILGSGNSHQQFEMPFRKPADFHNIEEKIKQEVETIGEYRVDKKWKEVSYERRFE
jgi:hypothetical protein